jgi:hypothetical protein
MEVDSAPPGEKQMMCVLDPFFFQAILYLREQQRRPFDILIRSFGSYCDEAVALELDAFFFWTTSSVPIAAR